MKKVLLLILTLTITSTSIAQKPIDLFEQGNALYKSGNYDAATQVYQKILSSGYKSAEVYFNLGNAYYRQEQLGQAILAYERANRLKPGDPDIQHNLKLCYLKTIDRIEPLPDLFIIEWIRSLTALFTRHTSETIFISAWILFFLSLASVYLLRKPEFLRLIRITVIASFTIIILSGCLVAFNYILDTSGQDAIITAHTVTAKSSPDPMSVDAFVIHEGLKVKVTDSVATWIKITLPDGKVGWIEKAQCEKI